MPKVQSLLALIVVGSILAGCSQEEATAPRSAEIIFESAMEKYKNEDFQEAYEEFRILTLQYPGSALSDDAQFLMGECKFAREEFILSAYEYEVVVRTMPTSEFVPNARYKMALCHYESARPFYLEQESTRKSVDGFQAFIEYHPTDARVPEAEAKIIELNTRLAQKEFESGLIYMKMDYYRAAGVSFDHVLEKYHDSPYAEPAYFKKGEALFYRRRYKEAGEVLKKFIERYPTSAHREDALSLMKQIEGQTAETRRVEEEVTQSGGIKR
ncbi:MAG: outer membrane protein assembly factor BamD [Bacteroidota bacterium]